MTEEQMIHGVLQGDVRAERALYDAHVDRVYRLAWRLTGDGDHASDCVQETFIKVFEKLGDFRGDSALGTWIGAIARSVALNLLRSTRRKSGRHVELTLVADDVAHTAPQSEPDLRSGLHRAIAALPDGYRTVFLLHDVEGYTHQEIGETLGISDGTSKAQLSRARSKLRTALASFAPQGWQA